MPPLPLGFFLSNDNTGENIGTYFLHAIVSKMPFSPLAIVIDGSFALLNAVLSVSNYTLEEFLDETSVMEEKKIFSLKTFPLFCNAHLIKAAINFLRRQCPKTPHRTKKILIAAFARFLDSKSTLEATEIFKLMCRVFHANNCDVYAERTLFEKISGRTLGHDTLYDWNCLKLPDIDDSQPMPMLDKSTVQLTATPDSLYVKSPYGKLAKNIFEHNATYRDNEACTNDLAVPKFIEYIAKKKFPLLPIVCSGILLNFFNLSTNTQPSGATRISNATVEGYFSKVKNIIIKGKSATSEVIHHLREDMLSATATWDTLILLPNANKPKPYKKSSISTRKESFKKKSKPKNYHNPNFLQRLNRS